MTAEKSPLSSSSSVVADLCMYMSDSLSESSPESHSGRRSSKCVPPANAHPSHCRADSHSPSPKAEPMSAPEACSGVAAGYAELSELITDTPLTVPALVQRPLIVQNISSGVSLEDTNGGTYINLLYDLYGPTLAAANLGTNSKDREFGDTLSKAALQSEFMANATTQTVFRAQEKYVVTLGAPISIAQRQGEDTLTYLNRGQFYGLQIKANMSMDLPTKAKSLVHLTFFDEPDKKLEASPLEYWYNIQANPTRGAFDIDRKSCENISDKPEDLTPNMTSFVWNPELGAKIVLRINCLSTEFSPQKGVKGLPLHLVVDTYEDMDTDKCEPVHRGYCRVKIFRDKGAERKNKDETKNVERRMQRIIKQQSVTLDADFGPNSVFHSPSKETILTSTTTFGPKPFVFIPQQKPPLEQEALVSTKAASTSLLASIRERETKRTFSNILSQAKEDLDNLEVAVPAAKTARIPQKKAMTTIYVKKDEEKVYNALLLDSLTVHDLKLGVSRIYDVPVDMIKCVFKKTKKGLLVNLNDDMVAQFEDEDDFLIDLLFDNHKGHFNLCVQY
eukprot:Em0022g284a